MRTYLEACTVPTARIGGVDVPRLIMGIHPFDGCGYVSAERDARMLEHFSVVERIVEVLAAAAGEGVTMVQTDHMVPHLNRQHLTAIWKASERCGVRLGTIPFLVVPLTLDGQPVDQKRVHATFDRNAYERYGERYREYLRTDPIVGYLTSGHGIEADALVDFNVVPPYEAADIARMQVDYGTFERNIGFFEGFEPLLADPGAEVDLLAAAGRIDLIEEYIAFLRRYFPAVAASVHHPGVTLPALEELGASFDAYITPVNKLGVFMLPVPDAALAAVRACRTPVIAIKPMGGGRLVQQEAFDYVLNEVGVAATMFGLGTLAEVRQTVDLARQALS